MRKIWFILVLWVSKLSIVVSKLLKMQGSMISGKVAVFLQKDFIRYFKNIDYDKVIFVTGTNGKSTTNNLLAHTIKESNKLVATNSEGANMISGVATTLIKNSNAFGKFNKEFLVLEIDERSLKKIYKYLPANNLCITNLQKDQVQRNGDPDFIYKIFKDVVNKKMTLFVNNEEARSRSLEDYAGKTIYFSLNKNSKSFIKDNFYDVTMACPKCNHKLNYKFYNVESIGKFECSHCEYKSLAKPNVLISNVDFENYTFKCEKNEYKVPYINPFFLYNYALVISVCKKFNIKAKNIQKGFESFINPADRRETYKYHGKTIRYLRMKQENPETLQNALDTVARDKGKKALFMGLYVIRDFKPQYTNTFYFFDCDFEKIAKTDVEEYVCFSTPTAFDTANRMIYAGADKNKIKIYDTDDNFDMIFSSIDNLESKTIYIITGMKPYHKIKSYFQDKQVK